MKFKKAFFVSLLMMAISGYATSQNTANQSQSVEKAHTATLKLIDYYRKYDTISSEKERRQKFDDFYDAISSKSASKEDKDLAFKFVNAYIKAENDNSITSGTQQAQSIDDFIKSREEYQQAEKKINIGYQNFMNSSFEDFEKFIRVTDPAKSRREIKTLYNQLHQKDGKQVQITAADDELTPEQQVIWAMETIENPKSYGDFERAAKILNPKITDEKIQQGWNKINKTK